MICVAHRLSNLARADRLLVMQEGGVFVAGFWRMELRGAGRGCDVWKSSPDFIFRKDSNNLS